MSDTHIVSVLWRKRAEIGGHIHDLEKRIGRQRTNLANLDATIKLFSLGANPDAIPPKRAYRRTRYFAHNELSRLTQDALRTASGPLGTAEIAAAVMQAKGMHSNDAAFKEIVADRALTVLRRLAKRGTAVRHGATNNYTNNFGGYAVNGCAGKCLGALTMRLFSGRARALRA
jgi:hypothetical protein